MEARENVVNDKQRHSSDQLRRRSRKVLLLCSLNNRTDTAGWLKPLQQNSEAMMNNNITHDNNHLLLWHKEGNKKLNLNRATQMFHNWQSQPEYEK